MVSRIWRLYLIVYWLVVSNMNVIFHFIYGIILSIDELIFFKMVIAPPTSHDLISFQFNSRKRRLLIQGWHEKHPHCRIQWKFPTSTMVSRGVQKKMGDGIKLVILCYTIDCILISYFSHAVSGISVEPLIKSPFHQAIRATTGTAFSPFGTYSVELKDTSAPWKPVPWPTMWGPLDS